MDYIRLREHIPGKDGSVEWLFLTYEDAVKKMNNIVRSGRYKQIGKHKYSKEENVILEIISVGST